MRSMQPATLWDKGILTTLRAFFNALAAAFSSQHSLYTAFDHEKNP
jgi:hypothetical protein